MSNAPRQDARSELPKDMPTRLVLHVARRGTLQRPVRLHVIETWVRANSLELESVIGVTSPCSYSVYKRFKHISVSCGSVQHNLSRCKAPEDPHNPLPYASCFVCNGKGHLASSCPQNKDKGVYPNGGCCKLCGETSHLAKDCGIRKQGTYSRPTTGSINNIRIWDSSIWNRNFHWDGTWCWCG